jgi:hypothetical protein
MPLPLLAGLGGLSAGIGSATGGLLFGSAATGIPGAAGYTAATGGLLGAGGSFAIPQAMMTAGMGLSAASAFGMFGGGTSTGGALSTAVPLTQRAQKLEKAVWEKTKEDWEMASAGQIPANMAAPYIHRMKAEEEQRYKESEKILTGAAAKRGERTSGGNLVGAAIIEGGQRMEGLTAPSQWRAETRKERFVNSVNQLANMMNIESQAPVLHAQAMAARSGYAQYRSAQQGRAIGDLASMVGLMTLQGRIV